MKCKHFWFSVTEEYLQTQGVNLLDVLCSYKTIKKYAYILHDRDVYTPKDEMLYPAHKAGTAKPRHYHVYCNFGNQSIDHTYFASLFKVIPESIKRIETTAANCLLYFVHGTADAIAEGKYQYEWSDVHHSSNWNPQTQAESVRYIGHFEQFSYKEQIDKVHQIPDVQERVKMQELLDKALAAELKYRATIVDRYVRVMFVTGESGCGKTTFARQFAEKMNYFDIVPREYWRKAPNDKEKPFRHLDYGVSGASNDVFESYKGEDVYILDDMRDDSFSFSDVLKFLDNHTNSSVKSRFSNKTFIGVLLIITSTVPLSKWYIGEKNPGRESLKQLYRRISTYVEITEREIYFYSRINDKGEPYGEMTVLPNRTRDYYKDKPAPIDLAKLAVDAFGRDDEFMDSLSEAFEEGKAGNRMPAKQVKFEDIF